VVVLLTAQVLLTEQAEPEALLTLTAFLQLVPQVP
jgi:hypothetical protein